MNRIYLDNAASSFLAPESAEAMLPFMYDIQGNPSSVHSFGKPMKVMIEDARELIADFLGTKAKEIFFTSGGTESNNFSIKGAAFSRLNSGKRHIITTSIEHPAVLETIEYLRDIFSFEVTIIKPDRDGRLDPEKILENINENTFLISVMHSNNETGLINNINPVAEFALSKGILMHSDTVQSIGKTILNLKRLNVDFATLSGHKIYGPKGIGILYIREGIKIHKYEHGGGQERNMKGGTENVSAIAGLKSSVELLSNRLENDIIHYYKLGNYLKNKLVAEFGNAVIFNSGDSNSLPNIINFSFDRQKVSVNEDMLIIQLDIKGIAVSGGSACSSGSLNPSRVLTEMGIDSATALASIRASFGRQNTEIELDYFVSVLKELITLR